MTLLDEFLAGWRDTRAGVIAEVENLPPDRLSSRPEGLPRTPLELVHHIAESGRLMAGELSRADGDFLRKPPEELMAEHSAGDPVPESVGEAVALLRRSREAGERLLRDAGELRLLQLIRQFNGVSATRLSWLHHGIAHEEYHRGQLALYARLFGDKPALTKVIEGG